MHIVATWTPNPDVQVHHQVVYVFDAVTNEQLSAVELAPEVSTHQFPVSENRTYRVQVTAVDEHGAESPDPVWAEISVPNFPPAAPTDLTLELVV